MHPASTALAGAVRRLTGNTLRRVVIEQSKRANVGHIGSALSVADIVAALYDRVLCIPDPDDADLDRDGHLELAVASAKSPHVAVPLADAAGGVRTTLQEAGTGPFAVAAADLDGDGFVDPAVTNETNAGERRGDVTVLYALADGGFAPASSVPHGGGPAYGLAAGDLDQDGSPDLAVADAAGLVRVLRNRGGAVRSVDAIAERQPCDGLAFVVLSCDILCSTSAGRDASSLG